MPGSRLALTLLLAWAAPAAAQESAPAQSPRIEFASPPFTVPEGMRDSIRFGWLTVPRDHADPSAGTLRLAVSIIAASTTTPAADPVVVLPGGPGAGLVERRTMTTALSVRAARHRLHRAMVLLDPRGHGLSEPRTCAEVDVAPLLAEAGAAEETVLLRKLAACRERAEASGERIDLLAAVHVARDLEWLRRALDAPQLNLVGASYGTRLVAEAMREVPNTVRTAMMHGPVPPGVQKFDDPARSEREVMDALFRRCAEQPPCRTAFPDLRADYDTLLARITRSPVIARVPRSDRALDGRLVLDITLMRPSLAELGYSRDIAAGAPLLIHTLARTGHEPLGVMAARMLDVLESDIALDTYIAFRCNDAPPAMHEAESARCRTLLGDDYGDTSGSSFVSDVPALVFGGEFDPRTPPSDAHLLGAGLTRSHVIILPWYGHQGLPDCAFAITDAFIREPDRALDLSCVDSIPPVRFATSVTPSRWVARATARAVTQPARMALPAGAALLLLLVPFVALPVRAVRSRRPATLATTRNADIALWLTAAAGIALVLGTAAAVMAGARRTVLLPMLGVPPAWGWILLLPWLLALLALAAAVLFLRHRSSASATNAAIRWSGFLGTALLLALWLTSFV